ATILLLGGRCLEPVVIFERRVPRIRQTRLLGRNQKRSRLMRHVSSSPFWLKIARPSGATLAGMALCLALGCRASPPADEKTPPAVVKWEGPQQVALEEWTELAGTTMPLLAHTARVSAPVEGRVVSLLTDQTGKTVVEGQRVEKGTVLVQLDTAL